MYEEPWMKVIHYGERDVICTSIDSEEKWNDENADENGWV